MLPVASHFIPGLPKYVHSHTLIPQITALIPQTAALSQHRNQLFDSVDDSQQRFRHFLATNGIELVSYSGSKANVSI